MSFNPAVLLAYITKIAFFVLKMRHINLFYVYYLTVMMYNNRCKDTTVYSKAVSVVREVILWSLI